MKQFLEKFHCFINVSHVSDNLTLCLFLPSIFQCILYSTTLFAIFIFRSVNESGFQAAAAAAAAAAASLCVAEGVNEESLEPKHFANTAGVVESSNGVVASASASASDVSRPAVMRSLDDANEYPKYGWVDITDEFLSACGELNMGELAQDVFFGLFEAMSAIEMMDPKMDVGMGYNRHEPPPHTFQSAAKV